MMPNMRRAQRKTTGARPASAARSARPLARVYAPARRAMRTTLQTILIGLMKGSGGVSVTGGNGARYEKQACETANTCASNGQDSEKRAARRHRQTAQPAAGSR